MLNLLIKKLVKSDKNIIKIDFEDKLNINELIFIYLIKKKNYYR